MHAAAAGRPGRAGRAGRHLHALGRALLSELSKLLLSDHLRLRVERIPRPRRAGTPWPAP